MKPRLLKEFVGVCTVLCAAVSLAVSLSAQTVTPNSSPAPKAKGAAGGKKEKASRQDTGDNTLAPKKRGAKDIQFPVPVGYPTAGLKLPSYDQAGQVLSILEAAKATRIDDEHVQMEGMSFDLNPTGDKDAYHIEMPTSVFNLKTNVVSSDHPVLIRTKDFEITGEKAQFDTVERSGELRGRVHMRIFNLKQAAAPGATPAT